MAKINKVERIALSGGIIGFLTTNPRAALEKKIDELNAAGWNCHQIINHSTRNTLALILQFVVLILTFGLWTFGAGYILLFEKETETKHERGTKSETKKSEGGFPATHWVKSSSGLGLRPMPNPSSIPIKRMTNGTEVQVLRTGDEVQFDEIKAPWVEVRTEDGETGWCFSGYLEKK